MSWQAYRDGHGVLIWLHFQVGMVKLGVDQKAQKYALSRCFYYLFLHCCVVTRIQSVNVDGASRNIDGVLEGRSLSWVVPALSRDPKMAYLRSFLTRLFTLLWEAASKARFLQARTCQVRSI